MGFDTLASRYDNPQVMDLPANIVTIDGKTVFNRYGGPNLNDLYTRIEQGMVAPPIGLQDRLPPRANFEQEPYNLISHETIHHVWQPCSCSCSRSARADEGMWLLHMLQRINEASMQEAGLRLSAQDIYDINNASLKDAIVRLNGGSCTAEVISSQGLVLTNHHCAYGAIQSFSTPENDYLTDGFWAKAKGPRNAHRRLLRQLPQRIDDVTERVFGQGQRRHA